MAKDLDLFAKCKDGREVAVEVRLSPLEFGDCVIMAVSIRDVSDRKAAELQLKRAREQIESLTRERLLAENQYLREEINSDHNFHEIIGNSQTLKHTLAEIERVAPTDASVLITGETGVGKELIARAIHDRSRRRDHPLVKLNCAALPASLIESELFGHEKGAFTGALQDRTGRFELADGGTIFLDEIGELDLGLQTKLLRVLQEGELERIGSDKTKSVDVRVIAATNRNLEKAIRNGSFRSDLYFRVAVFPINVAPLRERREDVPLLVWHFIAKHQVALGKTIDEIPETSMQSLMKYDWPGNVRELENVIQRARLLKEPTHKLTVGLV
jgi:transcriptional regulator with GAF, ATPase, and Fis domain